MNQQSFSIQEVLTLAVQQYQSGQLAEAESLFRRILEADPDIFEAHNGLGIIFRDLGRLDDAVANYNKAIALNPNYAEAHNNLGNALTQLGRLEDAVNSYQKALDLQPESPSALNNLGAALTNLGRLDAAAAKFEAALSLQPESAGIHNNLANVLRKMGRLEDAVSVYEKALALDPDHAFAHNNLGSVYKKLERHEDAVASFKKALAIKPDYSDAHSNLLFALIYIPDITDKAIFEEARRWNAQHSYRGEIAEHRNTPDPNRRLAIGYVSADFRQHATSYYLEPLVDAHDRDAVEVFCYAEVRNPDHVTERFKDIADHWRSTVGVGDAELADMIRDDGIDILVDCTGHTGHNRLPALTRKPAPVLVSHYPIHGGTSGVAAMDYALSDPVLSPPELEDHFSETVVLMPQGVLSFHPDPEWPGVEPPREADDDPVFLCVNDPARIGTEAISLWVKLLNKIEGARILFKHSTFSDPKTCEFWRNAFKALGDRADFEGLPGGWKQNMDIYGRVDISLDSLPMSGGVSCLIPMWMGVPVLTMSGQFPIHRFGSMIVTYSGMPELSANDEQDYLDIAAGLVKDRERLAVLRSTLRATLMASPMFDVLGRTADLEAAYRKMWRTWCEGV